MRTTSACFAVLRQLRGIRRLIHMTSSPWCCVWCYRIWIIAPQYWPAFHYLVRRLQSVNAAAQLVFSSSKCDHITPHLRQLHWLTVSWRRWRIEFKLAILVYKCIHGLAPSYLADELHHPAES